LPVAELVRPGSAEYYGGAGEEDKVAKPDREVPAKKSDVVSDDEKSATEERRTGSMKPRLSYILTGKPPAPPARPDGSPRRKRKADTTEEPAAAAGEAAEE
jgi:hypothetical protein